MPEAMSLEKVRRYYDAFGKKQDLQGVYENAAIAALIERGNFAAAHHVFELGCGTGKLAARLLSRVLPEDARYVGTDLSETMVRLARERVAPWRGRARIVRTDGDLHFKRLGGPFDRIIVAYVFDLMSNDDIQKALSAAHAALGSNGLLCSAGLTFGVGPFSRAASGLWRLIHRINPYLVGGCRPLEMADHLDARRWRVESRRVVVSAAIPSEVIIASPV